MLSSVGWSSPSGTQTAWTRRPMRTSSAESSCRRWKMAMSAPSRRTEAAAKGGFTAMPGEGGVRGGATGRDVDLAALGAALAEELLAEDALEEARGGGARGVGVVEADGAGYYSVAFGHQATLPPCSTQRRRG